MKEVPVVVGILGTEPTLDMERLVDKVKEVRLYGLRNHAIICHNDCAHGPSLPPGSGRNRVALRCRGGGFSALDKPQGPEGWFNPECQEAFWRGLEEHLRNPLVVCRQSPAHINSEEFSGEIVREILYLLEGNK